MNIEQENREIIRIIYEAAAKGDINTIVSALHEDFEEMVPPILPWGGIHRGVSDFIKVLPIVARAIDFPSLRLVNLSANGDRVSALCTGNTTSGKELWVCEHWKLHNGKVTNMMVFYHDTTPLIEAFESNMERSGI
ncbi:nuclear transport factor 2 family protein [Chryseobacterium sp. M5A1_1a]